MSLLETQGLGVSFGGVHAVKAVDFTLQSGELRCLIGPNGAGKSTFFKMLSGQLKPTRGACHFKGQRICGLAPHQVARLGIGIKTQAPSVFDGLDVLETCVWPPAVAKHPMKHGQRPSRLLNASAWSTCARVWWATWLTANANGWSWA